MLPLASCQQANLPASPEPTVTILEPTQSSPEVAPGIGLDYSAIAQNVSIETVPAQPATAGGPYWEGYPQYRLLTLEGYPITNHTRKPQIFIYTFSDLSISNENMGNIATGLQTLLETKQTGLQLPFLPLSSDAEAMHAQVQFMKFKNGSGVRFLTQLAQGISPINNHELFYTFQGLTSDNKYYVAAILPVSSPGLPADPTPSDDQTKALNDYRTYLSDTITLLNQQPASSYTPDLNILDALIQSLEIK